MPRKPTGRPTGRPVGSGRLGLGTQEEHTRLTVRIPKDLYTRLEAFAEGRSYTRGTPQLAGCVRALLEHALACPYKRQTTNTPMPVNESEYQPVRAPALVRGEIRQTDSTPPQYDDTVRQVESTPPLAPVTLAPQLVLDYDPHKYMLGSSCKAAGHLSHGDKGNLRVLVGGACVACAAAKKAAKAKAQRPTPVAKEV